MRTSTALYALTAISLGLVTGPLLGQQSGQRSSDQGEPPNEDLPLEGSADRRIAHIDLDEGSWMSLDVSPDGQTIVFDYLGDLFTLPIAGGSATQLTSGMAFDAQPRFSPDGSQVVFTSDRNGGQNIWVIALDASDTTQISKGEANRAESPEWSPDGDYIVASMSMSGFRFGGRPILRLFHIDGGAGVDLIKGENPRKTLGAAFGPDTRWVWYSERTGNGDWDYNAQLPLYQLQAYDRETGTSYTKVSRYGGALRPTLSPDGRWLVYGARSDEHTGLVLHDLENGDERWLAYPVQRDDQESRATLDVLPGMSFTPDSRAVLASYGGKIWRLPVDDDSGAQADQIPFRVTFDLEIAPEVDFDYPVSDSPTFTVRQIRDAVPSPDGSRLAFTAMDRLYLSNADGSDIRPLSDGTASEQTPAWSPDGEWIAFSAYGSGEGHIYKIRADGGDATRVTASPGIYITPTWSPNGDRIVAVRGRTRAFVQNSGRSPTGAANELVWMSADGGPATLIMPMENRSGPHFTENADRIFLRKAPDELVSVRWDGSDETTHVKVRGEQAIGSTDAETPSELRMAPRGDQAMALILNQVYSLTVPMVGGEAPTINVGNPANASFPARKLTKFGGEFPAWSADGRKVHWSLGNAHFIYDLDAAEAHEDSTAAADRAAADAEAPEEAEDAAAGDDEDEASDDDGYQPIEFRVSIEATRDIPQSSAVLRGARVVTMRGDEVIENADVVVTNNRITAVGDRGSVSVPDGATVIDVTGKTIVPGFVDAHSHIGLDRNVHRQDQWSLLANLAYGVTTGRDPQTGSTDVLTYADLVRAGKVLGPRVYSTGPGVFFQTNIDSQSEADNIMRRYSEYFDTKTLKMYVAGTRQQRQWIIKAARDQGIMPTTEGSLNLKQNITETLDGYPGLEHSIPVYPLQRDMVELFVASGRTYTPTLLVSYGGPWAENYFYTRENPHDDAKLRRFTPHDVIDRATQRRGGQTGVAGWFREEEHVFQDHAVFVKELVEAGGRAGVGSHGQLQGLGYHWELWALQSGGMSEHDALRVSTIFGAEAIGLDQDLGSIEVGKLADLVVLDQNPLENIRNTNTISWVMKNGRLYEGDTLNETYPRQRALNSMWWWDTEPGQLPGIGGN